MMAVTVVMTVVMTVAVTVVMTVVMTVTVTVVVTSARAVMMDVMSGGPGGGRASDESNHCQVHQDPASSHWLAPWCCGSMPRRSCPDRMRNAGLIASPVGAAPPTASRQSRRATGTRSCNA
jgi:hypothetical protein